MSDEFDILKIEEKIEWALNTIRDKETFGLDQLNASLSRERRAKGVLLDCKKEIQQLKQQLESCESKNKDLCDALMSSELDILNENIELKQQLEEAVEVIEELYDIVVGHIEEGDKLDSFTLQPAKQFLAKCKSLENNVTEN